jgi:alpha-mannosidase
MSPEHQKGFNTDGRRFVTMEKPCGVFENMKSVQVIENGEIYLGIEAFFEDACSKARIAYKIYKNTDDVDIDVNVYMGDIDRMIKLRVPMALEGELVGQTSFGTVPLFTDGRENVAHRFIAMNNGDRCVALMNRDVYGSHYESGSLYMSLVRGVTYCAHWGGDPLIPKDKFTKKVDQGENNYSFRLTVGKRETLERRTLEFTQKPYAQNIFPVPAETKGKKPFDFKLGDEIITLVTLKKKDQTKDAFIFRLLNNTEGAVDTYLEVNGERIDLSFGKYEVKTVVYENGSLTESYELLI